MLRMLGLQYYGAQKHLAGANDGIIWDKVLRCGVEYEKSTRDQQSQDDILFLVNSYKTTVEFLSRLSAVDQANPRFQEWYKHLDFYARKVRIVTLICEHDRLLWSRRVGKNGYCEYQNAGSAHQDGLFQHVVERRSSAVVCPEPPKRRSG